jgi:tRNA C32,U32 (ribose-2'-O)-methylase TrmJ
MNVYISENDSKELLNILEVRAKVYKDGYNSFEEEDDDFGEEDEVERKQDHNEIVEENEETFNIPEYKKATEKTRIESEWKQLLNTGLATQFDVNAFKKLYEKIEFKEQEASKTTMTSSSSGMINYADIDIDIDID